MATGLQESETCAVRSRGQKTVRKALLKGTSHVHDPLSPDDHLDARAVRRRPHRLRPGPLGALSATAPTHTSRCITRAPHDADVTEGSGGIWERLHYDWSESQPRRAQRPPTPTCWAARSGYTYTLTPQPSGKTDVDVVIVREGKNLKGRVLSGVLGTVGKDSLGKAFTNSVKAIEGRS